MEAARAVTDAGCACAETRATLSARARWTRVAQLLGRDSVVERIAAAVDRARVAGGGTVVVCGPGGVGTSAVVEEAMALLPEEQRTAIILKEYHGMTFQEISDLQGCPLSTVKTRLYQGLSVLRRQLEKNGRMAPQLVKRV